HADNRIRLGARRRQAHVERVERLRRADALRRSARSPHRRRRRLLPHQSPHRLHLVTQHARRPAGSAAAVAHDAHDHRHADALRKDRRHYARRTVMKSERALAYAAFATVCFVWGTTYLAIRVAIETIPPLLLTGIRFTVAGLVLLGIGALRGEKLPRSPRIYLHALIVGVMLICIGNFAVVWAEQWVPSGMAALLVATAPFWAAFIEFFRERESAGLQRSAGMALGFVGVALLVAPRSAGGAWDVHFLLGAAAIQIGCIAWQYGSIHGKHELKSISPLMSSTLQMLAGGLLLDIAGVAAGEVPRFHVNARTLSALIYLTIFGSIIAYSAYV